MCKHVGLVRVIVYLYYWVDAFEVRVDDDGWGASVGLGVDGYGLVGMWEWAVLCGGELRVGSCLGGGWLVVVNLLFAVGCEGVV